MKCGSSATEGKVMSPWLTAVLLALSATSMVTIGVTTYVAVNVPIGVMDRSTKLGRYYFICALSAVSVVFSFSPLLVAAMTPTGPEFGWTVLLAALSAAVAQGVAIKRLFTFVKNIKHPEAFK